MYVTLTAGGDLTQHEGIPEAAFIHETVGGYFEVVRLDDESIGTAFMWMNENGKREGLPSNAVATILGLGFQSIQSNDFIVGTVVFTGGPDSEGETTTLPEGWGKYLRFLLERVK